MTSAPGGAVGMGGCLHNKEAPTTGGRLEEQESLVVDHKLNEGEEVPSCEPRSEF